jgi:AcrR family transcriptional regulator
VTTAQAHARAPRAVAKRRGNARDRLVGIAARLFREHGYTGTSVRDIARRAGVEPAALYHHFRSKEALLEEILDRSILGVQRDVETALAGLPEDCSPRERLRHAITAHLHAINRDGELVLASRRLSGQLPPTQRRKHAALRDRYGAYWQHLFEEAARQGHIRADAPLGLARMFLMGAMNWSSEWYDARRKSPEQLAQVFCVFLLSGVGTPHEPSTHEH